jgi:NitT/TauT family transport system substrate-binding protein
VHGNTTRKARIVTSVAHALAIGYALTVLSSLAAAEDTTIHIGMARSTSNAAELMAIEKGYLKEYGIKLEIDDLDSSANAIALLAQNRYQIVAGGISAGYFNALQKDFPIIIVTDRVSTPIGHNLMLRPDLADKVRDINDLKGKVIASNGPGSVSTYEVGKILEKGQLGINDVEIKILPFTQMAIAFANKAIDGAIVIPPFVWQLTEQRVAVPFAAVDELVEPRPMTIAVIMINSEWAKKNPNLVRNYFTAWLRGARDYCQAYHGGANRSAIIDVLMNSGTEKRAELLHKYPWPARSPDGRINLASMLDIQAWYVKNRLANVAFPAERLVDTSYIDHAVQKLGPFVLENKGSELAGCR